MHYAIILLKENCRAPKSHILAIMPIFKNYPMTDAIIQSQVQMKRARTLVQNAYKAKEIRLICVYESLGCRKDMQINMSIPVVMHYMQKKWNHRFMHHNIRNGSKISQKAHITTFKFCPLDHLLQGSKINLNLSSNSSSSRQEAGYQTSECHFIPKRIVVHQSSSRVDLKLTPKRVAFNIQRSFQTAWKKADLE